MGSNRYHYPKPLHVGFLLIGCAYANNCCSAMCEKQITVPDNRLLYCSERYAPLLLPNCLDLVHIKTTFPPALPYRFLIIYIL